MNKIEKENTPLDTEHAEIAVSTATKETPETKVDSVKTGEKKEEPKSSKEYRFAAKLVNEKQYAFDHDRLYKWVGNHWKAMPRNYLAKEAKNFLSIKVKNNLMKSCVEVAKVSLPLLPAVDSDRVIIPCKKWYIEVLNGKLIWRKPHPSYGFTYFIDTSSTDKPGKSFIKYLASSVPEKDIQSLLQEYAGYTLLNDNRYEAAMLLSGVGANGKSVFIEILRALHVSAKSMRLDQMNGFELSAIVGSSLLTSDETPKKKVCVDTLKALISGNSIQLRAPYGQPFDYTNRAKILVSANEIPAFDEQASNGFWRRFIFVPFDHVVPESQRNPLLAKEIINRELGSVLKWALDGLIRLMKNNGQFTKPACTEALKDEVKISGNSVLQWLNDHDAASTSTHVTLKTDVYHEYYDWADENGLAIVSATSFWKQMKYKLPFNWSDKQKRDGCRKVKRFVNFKINPAEVANDPVVRLFNSVPKNDEEVVDDPFAANEFPF